MLLVSPKHHGILNIIFSRNLMRCLINQLSKKDRFLFRAAEKSVKAIQDTIQADPDIGIPILSCLIAGNGIYNFDQATKTKTVDKLLAQLRGHPTGSAIQCLQKFLLEVET
jgi:DNA polymerase phi